MYINFNMEKEMKQINCNKFRIEDSSKKDMPEGWSFCEQCQDWYTDEEKCDCEE